MAPIAIDAGTLNHSSPPFGIFLAFQEIVGGSLDASVGHLWRDADKGERQPLGRTGLQLGAAVDGVASGADLMAPGLVGKDIDEAAGHRARASGGLRSGFEIFRAEDDAGTDGRKSGAQNLGFAFARTL
jgi:hypothetical protein